MEEFLGYDEFRELSPARLKGAGADEILHAFQEKVLKGEPQDQVLNYIFDALGIFIPFDRVGVALVEGPLLRSTWTRSRLPVEHLPVGYSAKIAGSSLENLLVTRQPRAIGDLEAYFKDHPDSRSTALILKDGMRSSLTFPLQLRGRPFGVVFFSSANHHVYTLEHARLLESVAQGLALALDHARDPAPAESNLNQEKMITRILHDLRSPLSVMVGFADLLHDAMDMRKLSEESRRQLSVIRKNASHALSLVNDLSDFEILRLNALTVQKHEVVLDEFLLEIAEALWPVCAPKGIRLQVNASRPGLKWSFDPRRIRQVLENLVSNAVKFSLPGGFAELKVAPDGERLKFSVADGGQGIAEEDLPKLFQEFGTTATRPTGGEPSTGLGLMICRQIINAHGGEITVHSQKGAGSTFEFWLPK